MSSPVFEAMFYGQMSQSALSASDKHNFSSQNKPIYLFQTWLRHPLKTS